MELLGLNVQIAHIVFDHPQGLHVLDVLEYLVGSGVVDQNLVKVLCFVKLTV